MLSSGEASRLILSIAVILLRVIQQQELSVIEYNATNRPFESWRSDSVYLFVMEQFFSTKEVVSGSPSRRSSVVSVKAIFDNRTPAENTVGLGDQLSHVIGHNLLPDFNVPFGEQVLGISK